MCMWLIPVEDQVSEQLEAAKKPELGDVVSSDTTV